MKRPFVLTIAGHDPSGGAGLTADCKVFEQLKTVGLSVCTATTVQTEDEFISVNWLSNDLILQQINIILKRYSPAAIKIGLIPSFNLLDKTIALIRNSQPQSTIIWDPILSSSTGFTFHKNISVITTVMNKIDLITPNYDEALQLFGSTNKEAIQTICEQNVTNVLLKGGHSNQNRGNDFLVSPNNISLIKGENQHTISDKHGTGCILSAAIAASIAKGQSLQEACITGKRYVERAMFSNPALLAWHS